MYFIHTHDMRSPTIGMQCVRRLENYADVIKVIDRHKVYYTNCDHAALIMKELKGAYDQDLGEAIQKEHKARRNRKTSWADSVEEELNLMELELNKVDEEEDEHIAWDDVKDVELDLEKVKKAREVEMTYIKKRKVYKYAERSAVKKMGREIIGVKWVDTNRGDEEMENYRSRLVAQEFQRKDADGLFAATPPLESLKILINIFVQEAYKNKAKPIECENGQRAAMMLVDIKRAHFYAPAQRQLYVELPPEDPEHGNGEFCGELLQSLYGTRDASSNWEREYGRTLERGGFAKGVASPCRFWHSEWQVRLLVHGDDFFAVGPMGGLENFKGLMESTYDCKIDCIGIGKNDAKQLRVLGRVITINEDGVSYECDQRHAESVCHHLGVEGGNKCTTPWEKESSPTGEAQRNKSRRLGEKVDEDMEREEIEELGEQDKKTYQSMSARLNYMAPDRPDVQFAVKELMRKMSCPNIMDLKALKRVARYLVGAPRLTQDFLWHARHKILNIYVDSDFAGCRTTRKSTSGGVINWGGGTLKTWSRTQTVVALSSGEAELAAIVKGSSEGMGMKSVLWDFGIDADMHVLSNARAAIGMVMREGLGKVRHLAVADLWVQGKRDSKEIVYEKVDGLNNPADMLTKVNGEKIQKYSRVLGFRTKPGRHELMPRFMK